MYGLGGRAPLLGDLKGLGPMRGTPAPRMGLLDHDKVNGGQVIPAYGFDLRRWFRASDTPSLSQLDTWPDASSYKQHLTQSTIARRPDAASLVSINGKRGVYFDFGNTEWMVGSDAGLPLGDKPRTIFAVLKMTGSNRMPVCAYGSGVGQNTSCDLDLNTYSGTDRLGLHAMDSGRVGSTSLVAGTDMIVGLTYSRGEQIQNALLHYFDGVETTTQMMYTVALPTSVLNTTSNGSFYVGTRPALDLFGNMALGELVLLSKALTQLERYRVVADLAWRWGLQAGLSAANPWKSKAP